MMKGCSVQDLSDLDLLIVLAEEQEMRKQVFSCELQTYGGFGQTGQYYYPYFKLQGLGLLQAYLKGQTQGISKSCSLAMLLVEGKSSSSCSFVCQAGVEIQASTSYDEIAVGSESHRIPEAHCRCQEANGLCLPHRDAGPCRWPDLVWLYRAGDASNTQPGLGFMQPWKVFSKQL